MVSEEDIGNEDRELFNSLVRGEYTLFEKLYEKYRTDFIKISSSKFNQLSEADIIDAWQDCIISFYQQIKSGKLTKLTCSIKSYLYLIGFRYAMKYHKLLHSKNKFIDEFPEPEFSDWDLPRIDHTEKEIFVFEQIATLSEQSRKLLLLRYVDGKTIPEIMKEMNYQSVNAVSVSLSRAIKTIRDNIHLIKNE